MSKSKEMTLKDTVGIKDLFGKSPGIGFRTEIWGTNELGEELFRTNNSLVIGGALFTLEKLFGVSSPLSVDYLNNILGFGQGGKPVTEVYPKDNTICLFGVGIGGAGDATSSVYDVDFKDRELPQLIPFRSSATPLSEVEKGKYWGMKETAGKKQYYLKKFETQPQIRVLWDDAAGEDDDGSPVEPNVHESIRTEGIETFIELVLKLDKNDCREFFEDNGEIEKARVNSIGLFTGVPVTEADGTIEYKQVKLFSMLNIYNEMLSMAKELNMHYRIYTS